MNKFHVMVVDDIEANRYMLQYMLQSQGAIVSTADHGESALQQLHTTRHDLIISDILMPVMDGYQLCRECKKDPELADIPFIFYTATYTTDEDRDFSLSLGANRFIIKPAAPDVLLTIIREVIEQHAQGRLQPVPPSFQSETELLEKYNSRLVHKLEDKLTQLEQANHRLDAELLERNKLERQLVQAQKMEAIGTMVSGVSHNFNNILIGILGKVYLAKSKLGSDISYARIQLDGIDTLANNAAEIISELMRFGRKEPLHHKVFNLRELLTNTINTARIGIPEDISLQVDIPSDNLIIDGEASQIQQVVLNILNNARDAILGQKTKRIQICVCQLSSTDIPDEVAAMDSDRIAHIAIQDSGCGMSSSQLQHVFEPFYTTKGAEAGTGLGLSTAYAIVHAHGGCITCDSQLGSRTTFNIYLPLCPSLPQSNAKAASSATPTIGHGETILLVEDEAGVRRTTKSILDALGYQVICAENGKDGLEKFQQNRSINLILSDITMPEMNGVEMMRAIIATGSTLPIILASGYDIALFDLSNAEKSRVYLMEKPYTIIPLSHTIHALLHPS